MSLVLVKHRVIRLKEGDKVMLHLISLRVYATECLYNQVNESVIPYVFRLLTRGSEVSMEQYRNGRMVEVGYPRENPPTSGIIRHDTHMRKSGGSPTGNRNQSTAESENPGTVWFRRGLNPDHCGRVSGHDANVKEHCCVTAIRRESTCDKGGGREKEIFTSGFDIRTPFSFLPQPPGTTAPQPGPSLPSRADSDEELSSSKDPLYYYRHPPPPFAIPRRLGRPEGGMKYSVGTPECWTNVDAAKGAIIFLHLPRSKREETMIGARYPGATQATLSFFTKLLNVPMLADHVNRLVGIHGFARQHLGINSDRVKTRCDRMSEEVFQGQLLWLYNPLRIFLSFVLRPPSFANSIRPSDVPCDGMTHRFYTLSGKLGLVERGDEGEMRSLRKPAEQHHFQARFSLAKIREWPGRGLNPVRPVARESDSGAAVAQWLENPIVGPRVKQRLRVSGTHSAESAESTFFATLTEKLASEMAIHTLVRRVLSNAKRSLVTSGSRELMRVKRGMGQQSECKPERGRTGEPRENLPTSTACYARKPGSYPPGNRTRFACVVGERCTHFAFRLRTPQQNQDSKFISSIPTASSLNFTVVYALELASFLHWLLRRREDTPSPTELHVIGTHNCEVLLYWHRATQGTSHEVWSNDKRIAKIHDILPICIATCLWSALLTLAYPVQAGRREGQSRRGGFSTNKYLQSVHVVPIRARAAPDLGYRTRGAAKLPGQVRVYKRCVGPLLNGRMDAASSEGRRAGREMSGKRSDQREENIRLRASARRRVRLAGWISGLDARVKDIKGCS
ncbi:hypothetical protein PR048_030776 [Dryococelus australis]|uniref:Uncharacterized protein n=1 Tax=Dryococelus australis TaxID=614101 RepID=A0ABQ9GDQ7_9NEOP|nr:hypothetical protein PR048_030776 [Dryococelus australis]